MASVWLYIHGKPTFKEKDFYQKVWLAQRCMKRAGFKTICQVKDEDKKQDIEHILYSGD